MLVKVLELFVGKWIVNQLTDSFDNNQFRSLKGRSTSDNYPYCNINSSYDRLLLIRGDSVRVLTIFIHRNIKPVANKRKREKTRMWANAQPDGRPAEHRWRPLFNAPKFG